MGMRLYATGFVLLVIWTDMGLVKNGGEYETLQECRKGWQYSVSCWSEELKKPGSKLKDWGQPTGFCISGERLNAPGVIYPTTSLSGGCL